MKKLLLLPLFVAFYYGSQAQGCIEIFISEYVEGWGNNKAIELYNPTNQPKNLSNYRLDRGSNGSQPGDNQKLVLSGTIQPYSTFVIVIDKRNPEGEGQEAPVWDELQAKADAFECPIYEENNTMYFNGNDALVLRNISNGGNGFVIDRIGRVGENPAGPENSEGWNDVPPDFTFGSNGATSWTKDHSMIRKPHITIGDLEPFALFNPSIEWDTIPPVIVHPELNYLVGNWDSLGSHDCECDPNYVNVENANGFDFKMFPNPAAQSETVRIVSSTKIDRYEVMDITGKLIDSKQISAKNQFDISLNRYNAGVYILRVYNGNEFSIQKLIVR